MMLTPVAVCWSTVCEFVPDMNGMPPVMFCRSPFIKRLGLEGQLGDGGVRLEPVDGVVDVTVDEPLRAGVELELALVHDVVTDDHDRVVDQLQVVEPLVHQAPQVLLQLPDTSDQGAPLDAEPKGG